MPPFLIDLLRRPLHLLAVLALLVAGYTVLTHRPGPPPDPMVELFEAVRMAHGIPGGVLAFGTAGEEPTVLALGLADPTTQAAMTADHRFRLASLTMPIAAALVLEAAAEGRLDLDAPLADQTALPAPGDARLAGVTPRQILGHRVGWDRIAAGFDPLFAPDRVGADPGASCAEIARAAWAVLPLDAAPGTAKAHAELPPCLLADVVTGGDLAPALARIAPGVDMARADGPNWVRSDDGWRAHYVDDGADAAFRNLGGAGGATASAESYWRFAARPHPARNAPAPEGEAADFHALGWRVWPAIEGAAISHTGNLPGLFTVAVNLPDGFTAVALFNGGVTDSCTLHGDIVAEMCRLRGLICGPP
ncbi:serine hydrolase [Jannaschia pohangensis]|uniref:CubicO group peptidase, beta-lactamase class C family n=1 Tax=Jannaschia pohangensis TaxID=390807 RepID=A0A1I3SFX5_9RHOB|nr:serine hydrolase domain-containing protein [Jannaschia pohangensis]SFJ56376.1 CubicO group peptidase, beta-lactamase class C family [Jannaschia pohangensis]